MTMLVIFCALVGTIVGLRFQVFFLVPAIVAASLCVAVVAVTRGDDVWIIIFTVLLSAVSLQVGYFCGSFTRFILADLRGQHHSLSPSTSATAQRSA